LVILERVLRLAASSACALLIVISSPAIAQSEQEHGQWRHVGGGWISVSTGAGALIDIDLDVVSKLDDQELIIPLPPTALDIRESAVMVQVMYSGPAGRSQWTPLPLVPQFWVFPDSIHVPVHEYLAEGLHPSGVLRVSVWFSRSQ
jgi:hypothetical protein